MKDWKTMRLESVLHLFAVHLPFVSKPSFFFLAKFNCHSGLVQSVTNNAAVNVAIFFKVLVIAGTSIVHRFSNSFSFNVIAQTL